MKLFSLKETYDYFLKLYQEKTIKYVELKKVLAEDIIKYLEPIRKEREKIIKKPSEIKKLLENGAKIARPIAQETLEEVKKKMGLI
jgi:tryptophanyl-tRNA synthetase